MTQSQLKLHSATSIITWAGKTHNVGGLVLRYVAGDRNFPYISKDGLFHYFAMYPDCYELVMTSSIDLNGE